jgi:geranylgeranyl diphosphate synthase type I
MVTTKTSPPGTGSGEPATAGLVDALHRELGLRWSSPADRVPNIAGYALLTPGKMIRPLLLIGAAEAVGGDRASVLPAALAVEYLHVATLIHDDVIDDDELRRGRPAVHARYGMADALVTGDFLILTMFSTLSECNRRPAATLEAARVLAVAGADVCRGQAREAELVGDAACEVADYEQMVALKTGALFRGACRAGAILGDGGPEHVEAITRYAEHLGVAFQIYDDLLPYLTDAKRAGKPKTSDIENLRPTFPVLTGYRSATPADRLRFTDALSGRLPVEDAYRLMRELLDRTGAIAGSRARAAAEIASARENLAGLPGRTGVELLGAIADASIDRDR